jgi:inositol-hexakisphosphate/diphosphoinositol-pentakisphosphate 1-kinase
VGELKKRADKEVLNNVKVRSVPVPFPKTTNIVTDFVIRFWKQIYTSSERRVIASAEIFAAALLDSSLSASPTPTRSGRSSADGISSHTLTPKSSMSLREPLKLIVRKDLLDDSNAAKDLMDDVKKRLKILLRPGEPEKRPELIWPKSMNKEPVEVLKVNLLLPKGRRDGIEHTQEAIELLSGFRAIMGRNFDTLDVDKIQERW